VIVIITKKGIKLVLVYKSIRPLFSVGFLSI